MRYTFSPEWHFVGWVLVVFTVAACNMFAQIWPQILLSIAPARQGSKQSHMYSMCIVSGNGFCGNMLRCSFSVCADEWLREKDGVSVRAMFSESASTCYSSLRSKQSMHALFTNSWVWFHFIKHFADGIQSPPKIPILTHYYCHKTEPVLDFKVTANAYTVQY